ncbi:MAG: SDR family oxidoreductase [Bacteroidota bacterium]
MTYNFNDLKNKTAVVTGGSGGIGIAIVEALLSVGANVVVLSRNKEKAEQTLSKIKADNSKAITVSADVLDRNSLERAKEQIVRTFGEIDLLVNCAGGNHPKATTAVEQITASTRKSKQENIFGVDVNEFKNVFDLNLFGTLLPILVFSESMVERKQGAILNISSVSSFSPLTKVPAYSASKASINNFTQWLAVHFAKTNVRVNALSPGFFITSQNRFLLLDGETGNLTKRGEKIIEGTPMGRFGETTDLQGAALFLLSDLSKFVTGVVLPVDGGFTAYSGV